MKSQKITRLCYTFYTHFFSAVFVVGTNSHKYDVCMQYFAIGIIFKMYKVHLPWLFIKLTINLGLHERPTSFFASSSNTISKQNTTISYYSFKNHGNIRTWFKYICASAYCIYHAQPARITCLISYQCKLSKPLISL